MASTLNCFGVVLFSSFAASYTCRFPRVVQIRDDKDWSDCMTRDEMLKIAEPAIRQTAGALLAAEEDDFAARVEHTAAAAAAAAAAAGGGGNKAAPSEFGGESTAGPAKREYDDPMGIDALLDEQRAVKKEESVHWGAGGSGGSRSDDDDDEPHPFQRGRLSQAQDLMSPPPAADGVQYEGLAAHMLGDGAGHVEVGVEYADGAGDWRAGDAEQGGIGGGGEGAGGEGADRAMAYANGDGGGGKGGKGKGKKRKKSETSKRLVIPKGTVLSLFRPTDVSNMLGQHSAIFENKCFCVMSTDRHPDKSELERMIVRSNAHTHTHTPTLSHTRARMKTSVQSTKLMILVFRRLLLCPYCDVTGSQRWHLHSESNVAHLLYPGEVGGHDQSCRAAQSEEQGHHPLPVAAGLRGSDPPAALRQSLRDPRHGRDGLGPVARSRPLRRLVHCARGSSGPGNGPRGSVRQATSPLRNTHGSHGFSSSCSSFCQWITRSAAAISTSSARPQPSEFTVRHSEHSAAPPCETSTSRLSIAVPLFHSSATSGQFEPGPPRLRCSAFGCDE